jgi:HAMP domain-containing protein
MRLLLKLNLALLLIFGAGMGIAGYISKCFLQRSAQDQVLQQARLMMEAARAMRTYTSKQVRPMLDSHRAFLHAFPPQTVPAYGATEVFTYLRERYPSYTYKEAALNPTNLRDRAVDWEADVIESFRNHPEQQELTGERETPEGRSMFLAHPLTVSPPCLECHSTPAVAPAMMVKSYGKNNGFNWKAGEMVAAQIVSVPTALPRSIADQAFKTLMLSLAGVAVGTLVLLDLFIAILVVRPVTQLSAMADEISKGILTVPELEVKGGDEIALLARSFNRMYLSLVKAIHLLEAE